MFPSPKGPSLESSDITSKVVVCAVNFFELQMKDYSLLVDF